MAVVFVLFILLSPLVSAGWVEDESKCEGSWTLAEHNNFESGWDDDVCVIWFNQTIANFTSWETKFSTSFVQDASFIETEFDIRMGIEGYGGEFYEVQVKNFRGVGINFFGLQWVTSFSGVAWWNNVTQDWDILNQDLSLLVNWRFKIFCSETNINILIFQIECYTDAAFVTCVASMVKTVVVGDGFFDEVVLFEGIREQSYSLFGFNAKILGTKNVEDIVVNEGGTDFNLTEPIGEGEKLWEIIWGSFSDATDYVGGVISESVGSFAGLSAWVTPLANLVYSTLVIVFPWLPMIFVFWFVDMGVTAVASGDFKPVGEGFTMLYSLAVHIGSLLVNIAQAIWNFVHFW